MQRVKGVKDGERKGERDDRRRWRRRIMMTDDRARGVDEEKDQVQDPTSRKGKDRVEIEEPRSPFFSFIERMSLTRLHICLC